MKPIVLVGEALGPSEDRYGQPLVGPSGAELLRMLDQAKVITFSSTDKAHLSRFYTYSDPASIDSIWRNHPEVHRTNVFNLHPPGNDISWFCGPQATAIPGYPKLITSRQKTMIHFTGPFVRAEFAQELERLCDEIFDIDPNVVVCLGNTPLWALAGKTGISKIRGTTLLSTHTVGGYKLLPTYHPAAIIREWSNRPTTIADLAKARRESEFPNVRRPPREIWIEPALDDIARFIREFIRGCDILSTDIETAGTRITCIGFAPSADRAIVIPFDDARKPGGSYWPSLADERACWRLIRDVLEDTTILKLFQNGVYDIAFLLRAYGIRTMGATHDTMLLSHALQPEGLKGLGYLGSIYSDEGTWKHMRAKDETIKKDA